MPYNTYPPYYGYSSFNNNYARNAYADIQQQAQPNTDIIWVQGEAGAKAYLVAPNTTVTLWDSESPTIYVKTSDGRGIPSMRVLDFTERAVSAQNAPNFNSTKTDDKTPIKDDINALRAKYDALDGKLKILEEKYLDLAEKAVSKAKKKETDE